MRSYATKAAMLADAGQRAATYPVVLTIRELIGYWGARGRGSRVVAQIRRDLATSGLQTDPGFEVGYIDNSIRLVPAGDAGAQGEAVAEGDEAFLRVDSLKCATQGLEMVSLDASIAKAMTVMALKDYSQLAVGSTPRSVRGAVTWESIGRRRLVGNVTRVGDALAEATVVATSDDLLPVLPQVSTAGFVFVQDATRSMVGIVTAADVTNEFGALAEPFFLLGEIERRLRLCLRNAHFDVAAYESVRIEDDPTREVLGPEDLTLGEVERLLENSDNWEKLGWEVDRKTFLARMAEVRDIRNSLMHFASDVPSDDDKVAMRNLLALLKIAGGA